MALICKCVLVVLAAAAQSSSPLAREQLKPLTKFLAAASSLGACIAQPVSGKEDRLMFVLTVGWPIVRSHTQPHLFRRGVFLLSFLFTRSVRDCNGHASGTSKCSQGAPMPG